MVIIGEVHDHPAHHYYQGAMIRGMAPRAVVFEMLTPERAARWEPALVEDPDALDEALGWTEAGWPAIELYLPVFEEITADMAVVGAAPPHELVREAVEVDAAAAFGEIGDPGRFGLDEPLPVREQAAREALQAAVHCDALPEELLPGLVEAQRLRDAAFADAVLGALELHGPPVVLLTGNGHARTDWGVPAALRVAAPDAIVDAIVQTSDEATAPPADLVVLSDPPPKPRPDPCAAFATSDGG